MSDVERIWVISTPEVRFLPFRWVGRVELLILTYFTSTGEACATSAACLPTPTHTQRFCIMDHTGQPVLSLPVPLWGVSGVSGVRGKNRGGGGQSGEGGGAGEARTAYAGTGG